MVSADEGRKRTMNKKGSAHQEIIVYPGLFDFGDTNTLKWSWRRLICPKSRSGHFLGGVNDTAEVFRRGVDREGTAQTDIVV